jgi:hypothetical protein
MIHKRIKTQMARFIGAVIIMSIGICAYAKNLNLAEYRVVTHSSSVDENHCGHLVVDGSRDTYWEGHYKDNDQWLLIDLGASQTVNQIKIYWGENYAVNYKLVLLSEDKKTEIKINQTINGTGGEQKVAVDALKARFVRINISEVIQPIRGCVIREINVMGEGSERFVPSQVTSLSANNLSLNGKDTWRVTNAMLINDEPQEIATSGYNDTKWIPASVPGTVLGDYYNFGALPDPLYGDNMHQISDEFFSGNNFWYRTEIRFPSELSGEKIFLNFSGINYNSEIYFNGEYLGQINGAFLRGEFEVSDLVNLNKANTVAVLVHHNPNWISGEFKVIRKTLGARTTNGDMLGLDGPTSLASAGWNWLPIIKGRNNGIWNNVTIRVGGNVSINDPWVSSTLHLPDTTKADLVIRTELKNNTNNTLDGKLVAKFDNTIIEMPVSLKANEEKTVILNKATFAELTINNPKLWWPNGYGEPNLKTLGLQFFENGKISDQKSINFGIRQLEYKDIDGILFIYCNGYKIQLKGGNWGLPEAMMRLDSAGYDLRVKLHNEANFNMIRNWIGMTNREEFYDACDRYGILIFDDFWLANPKNGPDPIDFNLFMDNVRDKIKWVRKHPSLAFYCGRNEGLPPMEYDLAMEEETELLDGTRHYVPHSADGTLSGFGPYEVKSPKWYFENRGETFHSELGIIAIPEVESIRRMMPEEDVWPISDMWAIHDYQYERSFRYTEMLNKRYGEANSVEEYSSKAQLQNYETGKAMFECLQSKQGSGMILWMSQSAWPSMICQLYDHYLEYTASYFAVKKASSPIHAFWDISKNEIRVANNTKSELRDATMQATIYDANGKKIWTKSVTTNVNPTSAKTCFALEHEPTKKVLFLKLELKIKGKLIGDNFYWLENKYENCLDLNDLTTANVSMNIVERNENGYYTARIQLKNESSSISLLNKIKVKDKNTGESILPIFLDDDYISLLPGEERTINIRVEEKYLKGKEAEIHLEGWNTVRLKMDVFGGG